MKLCKSCNSKMELVKFTYEYIFECCECGYVEEPTEKEIEDNEFYE